MEPFTWGNIWQGVVIISTIYAAIQAVQALKWPVRMGFTWGLTQSLAHLQKQRARLVRLQGSDREFYGWMLSGILWGVALFAAALMLESLMVIPPASSPLSQYVAMALVKVGRYTLGWFAGRIAMKRLGDYRALQRFDTTIANLDRDIAKLEAKLSLRAAPVVNHGA